VISSNSANTVGPAAADCHGGHPDELITQRPSLAEAEAEGGRERGDPNRRPRWKSCAFPWDRSLFSAATEAEAAGASASAWGLAGWLCEGPLPLH